MRTSASHPSKICWLLPPGNRGAASFANVKSANELAGFFPDWPVPYILMITRSESEIFSASLIDAFSQTIQINLLSLAKMGLPNSVLLGGSSRIDPKFSKYRVRPSALSGDWLKSKVAPWAAGRGAGLMYVRAYFEQADVFFQEAGFTQAREIGGPFMKRDLSQLSGERPALALSDIPEIQCSLLPAESALYELQDKTYGAEYCYFEKIRATHNEDQKFLVHAQLRRQFSELSRPLFEVQWSLAERLSAEFLG